MGQQKDSLTLTPNALNVLAANPGITFSRDDLDAAQRGELVLVGAGPTVQIPGGLVFPVPGSRLAGCIDSLVYGNGSNDLTNATIGGVHYSTATVVNLNEFREVLQDAANFGHRVLACLNTVTRRMSMLWIFPCDCTCDKRD